VRCYARNDGLGLVIPYEFMGIAHHFEPDFLVRLNVEGSDLTLLLEVKGFEDEKTHAKHGAGVGRGSQPLGASRPLAVPRLPGPGAGSAFRIGQECPQSREFALGRVGARGGRGGIGLCLLCKRLGRRRIGLGLGRISLRRLGLGQ
jgi:hypothetical protein